MPDYGHDLQFGVFATPTVADVAAVVERAVAAERAGLDLVTFQDHPYQPAFADTWTLLSWVAARTERVTLAGAVLNLPLRQPVVLARAVATLDRLSGGRVALGLGAGAFWDAIAAMGGPRRSPGESLAALAEAVQIVRGVWDADGPRPFRAGGTHYRVDGAKRGPAPAHPVPIWLGGYRPRMLRLIGRAADGWLPSASYLEDPLADLARGNAAIDAAALDAGRRPAEVRRLLNLAGVALPVDDLVALAVGQGFSVFLLASDDETEVRRFAAEVAPAVREAVARERTDPRGEQG